MRLPLSAVVLVLASTIQFSCAIVQCTQNSDCNDSILCNGVETCNTSSPLANIVGCVAGEPYDCAIIYGSVCYDTECDVNSCVNSAITPCCGNNIIEPGEVCDIGSRCANLVPCSINWDCRSVIGDQLCTVRSTSSCELNCQLPRCGDGYVNSATGEVCDVDTCAPGLVCNADCRACIVPSQSRTATLSPSLSASASRTPRSHSPTPTPSKSRYGPHVVKIDNDKHTYWIMSIVVGAVVIAIVAIFAAAFCYFAFIRRAMRGERIFTTPVIATSVDATTTAAATTSPLLMGGDAVSRSIEPYRKKHAS